AVGLTIFCAGGSVTTSSPGCSVVSAGAVAVAGARVPGGAFGATAGVVVPGGGAVGGTAARWSAGAPGGGGSVPERIFPCPGGPIYGAALVCGGGYCCDGGYCGGSYC